MKDLDLKEAVQVLRATPGTLAVLLDGAPESWLSENEGGDSWSSFDIVGHLVHGEKTDWITRARTILEHGESRTFEPFDRFAQFRDSAGRNVDDLLDEFGKLRAENVAELEAWSLTEADLDRTGTHPALGTVTLRQLIATWVVHDLGHIRQIARVLAKQYAGEVGPWEQYLRVVSE
ncbi:MAG: DinB family protein [Bacteroidetes bacterium]|nr:DinB family protein [Bacteroidota bacterium]